MKIFDPKLTGSIEFQNPVQGNIEITGDLVVPGSITAREFKTEFVSASILFSSGSTKFGDTLDDNHEFSGSVSVSGSVSIGTSDTGAKLTFKNEVADRKIGLYTVVDNNYQFYGFGIADNTLIYHTAATTDDHVFYAGTSSTTRNELMRIGGDGKVGIGTNNPGDMLTVYNPGNTYAALFYQSSSGTDKYNAIRVSGAMTSAIGYYGIGGSTTSNTSFRDSFVVGTQSAHSLKLATNDSAKVTIQSNGCVGIGVDAPNEKLHISGNVRAENTSTAAGQYSYLEALQSSTQFLRLHYLNSGYSTSNTNIANSGLIVAGPGATGGLVLRTDADAPIIFATDGLANERLRIHQDGYIGINKSNPVHTVHIGAAYNDTLVFDDPRTSADSQTRFDSSIVWDTYYDQAARISLEHNDFSVTYRKLKFQVSATTPGTYNNGIVLQQNNRVGINRNSPVSILELGDDTPTLTISDTGNNYNDGDVQAVVHLSGRWYSGESNPGADQYSDARMVLRKNYSDGTGGSSLAFEVSGQGATGLDEALRITKDRYVGIGTTSPGKKLTVRQDENGSPTIIKLENKDGNSNTGAFIGFSTGYNGWAAIGAKREGAENDSSLIFSPMLNESAVERMRITSTGYVGINTDAPAASLHIGNNVSSGGFGGFGDFQILLYQGASAATSYGLGIEGNTLMYNSQNYHKFYSSNNALGFISDDFSTLSNSNAGRHIYENKGGRLLTSNGTGWLADGRDPILTLATAGDSNNTSIAESIGLNLYTAGTTNGVHSPAIAFSNRSNSGNYESAFGIIIGKKTGQGVDTNWSAGELHFYTGKEAAYMDNNPDLRITSQGYILNPRQPAFFVASGSGPVTSATTAIVLTSEFVDVGNNYNTSNGRFTAPIAGTYMFFATSLHRMSSTAGSGEISFYKNGTNVSSRGLGYAGGGALDDDHDQLRIQMLITLAAGDYVTVGVYSISSGQDFYTQAGLSSFGGYLIG